MGKNIGVIPICSHCETGRKDYELDRKSHFCSHINCLKMANATSTSLLCIGLVQIHEIE